MQAYGMTEFCPQLTLRTLFLPAEIDVEWTVPGQQTQKGLQRNPGFQLHRPKKTPAFLKTRPPDPR